MNQELAMMTANVADLNELKKWGQHFSLERASEPVLMSFFDQMAVPRIVIEQSRLLPGPMLKMLMSSTPNHDIIVPNVKDLCDESAAFLRDILFQGALEFQLYYRFLFVGVSDRLDLLQSQEEVLALCTPIDLPLLVARFELMNAAKEIMFESQVEEKLEGGKVQFKTPTGHTMRGLVSKNTRLGELPYRLTFFHEGAPVTHKPITKVEADELLAGRVPESLGYPGLSVVEPQLP